MHGRRRTELCDRLDNDCSGAGGVVAAEDSDNDGHAPRTGAPCAGGPLPRDDCQDFDPDVYPGQTEYFAYARCADGLGSCECANGTRRCAPLGGPSIACSTACASGSSTGNGTSYDYDCGGTDQPPPSVSACASVSTLCSVGAGCGTDGYRYIPGVDCGEPATLQDRGCGTLGRCNASTTMTVRLPYH